jgi:L-glutamine:scyllo-inosose aminotransferase
MAERLALFGGPPVRARPWSAWPEYGDAERSALERVLASRSWGGFPSPNTEAGAFAERFARYVGTAHAVPCANGTVAIALALQAARLEPGAEVITTSYTFVGTATGILAVGGVPIFVDVLPGTYCLDPDQVEAAATGRTQAVVAVHLACAMADMDRLAALCEQRGLLLVEDCAHAHGARWRGRAAGSIGRLGAFSMQSSKLLTAGEGGAVTTDDALAAQRLHSLVNCGRKEPGYDAFPERLLGTNARLSEWQAAILSEQLVRLPGQHERRAARVAEFEKRLAEIPGLRPLDRDPRLTQRSVYQYVLRFEPEAFAGASRDAVLDALRAEGVPARGRFYVPLPDDPLFAMDPKTNPMARAGLAPRRDFPVASRAAYREAIWLPHELFLGGSEDVEDLAAAFAKVASHAGELASAGWGR